MNLGLRLGDIFQTEKGCFVVTGISFDKVRIGVLIKPYRVANDPHHPGSFISDELIAENEFEYKGNKLLGDV